LGILEKINSPKDLKKLNISSLKVLVTELRRYIIENVSKTGGHLASSLGVVELTVALHKVFNSPEDKIIWDVGHQCYAHKIITGRRDNFNTLRQYNGISGFPRSYESEYDSFNAGHASNSISAALGYACARDLQRKNNSVIAIIGDGAMSGGLSFEAINNASRLKSNFIVILNNNQMSISKNVGAMSRYLNNLRSAPAYLNTKKDVSNFLDKIPGIGKPAHKTIDALKSTARKVVVKAPIFDELGFKCFGPIDGHNIEDLIDVLERAKQFNGPVMINIYTKKGKGYSFAEKFPQKFHGIGKFDIKTGEEYKSSSSVSFSKVFGNKLIDIAKENKNVVAITAAMPDGTGLNDFAKEFPNRFYDVGIAEEHAVTFAGGLAKGGIIPVVAIYSTFLQRAYDNIFHDCVLQDAHVVFAIDRAGLVGPDGETHHGIFDISYLASLPNVSILAPSSSTQLEEMLDYSITKHSGVIAIRYPKSIQVDYKSNNKFEFGKASIEKIGKDITVVAEGNMLQHVIEASKICKYDIEIIDARTIKPIDSETIINSYNKTGKIISVEDNTIMGGLGSIIENALHIPVTKIGYNDELVTHGDLKSLYKATKVDPESIKDVIERLCK